MSAFHALLRRSLAEAGMSQMDLARAVGTSSSVVSQACTGQRPPPLGRVEAWAQALRLAPAVHEAFLAAAQLAHAPESVRRRIERLEQRLHEAGDTAWDGRRSTVPRVREGEADAAEALRKELRECYSRAQRPVADAELIDAAWEVHAMVAALLVDVADGAAEGGSAPAIRAHLERASAACREAHPTRPVSLRSALRRVAVELREACGTLDPDVPPAGVGGRTRG